MPRPPDPPVGRLVALDGRHRLVVLGFDSWAGHGFSEGPRNEVGERVETAMAGTCIQRALLEGAR